jgi:hypothetical protein
MMPVFPASPWQGMAKSIVIDKKIAKRSLFIVPSAFELIFAFTPDFSKLDACTSEKVYKKRFLSITRGRIYIDLDTDKSPIFGTFPGHSLWLTI